MPYQNMQSIRVIPWDQQASWVVPAVKNLSANAGDVREMDLICGLERSPGRGHGNPP